MEVVMSTTTNTKKVIPSSLDARVFERILDEGYGPGAWHGADLKEALADISTELAFWRPGPGRHNIAEIALHHAYCIRLVRGRLSTETLEPFVLGGEDWFPLSTETDLTWSDIRAVVDSEQQRLGAVVAEIVAGRLEPPLSAAEQFDNVLGITCHAIYHAGQVQLITKLHENAIG
jgi:DinB superfamily